MNQSDYPENQGGNCRGSWDSQDPRPHNAARDAPAHRREPMYCTNSNDCSGNGVGRAHGDSCQRSAEQSQSAGTFGAESTDRFELGDLGTHGMNYAPTPKISAQANGSMGRKDDWPLESTPVVSHVVRTHIACSKECARHDPHGF